MASLPDYRLRELHRQSRRNAFLRTKIKALADQTIASGAKAGRRGLPSDPAHSELSPVDAIRANKYQRLARRHWQDLPGSLLPEFANLRCHVVWASTTPALAEPFALRIPVVVDDMIIGLAFLVRTSEPVRRSTRAPIRGAAALLRLFVRYVETATSLDLRNMNLVKANQQTAEHRHEETKLRAELSRRLPGMFGETGRAAEESHTEQLVHRILDYIERGFARPITLKECARNLQFNAAYLSALFSRTVGLPFKSYLTRLRLEKARYLLSDPTRRVSDVAYAVGYADANRFRLAFKAATGLAPVTWRGSLQTKRSRQEHRKQRKFQTIAPL